MTKELFISCIVGIEEVLVQELLTLGFSSKVSHGGVYVPYTSLEEVYLLNLSLRTASRILLPLRQFSCDDKEDLYKEASSIDWASYLKDFPTFAIDVTGKHGAFTNSLFAAMVVKDAVCDVMRKRFGRRPSVDTKFPEVRFHLFLEEGKATIGFDTSGAPLHERGYRFEGGKAPLRESLAAALLSLSGFQGKETVVDPCCGSATLLIEAAMMATHTAPGLFRKHFGFMKHPKFSLPRFEECIASIRKKKVPTQARFYGIELCKKTVGLANKAIQKAGMQDLITILEGDFQTQELPVTPNFVICNPPYGIRLSAKESVQLETLYQDLGDFMKQKTEKPAKGAIFTGSLDLAKKVGLRTSKRHIVNNGGIECRLLEYDLY